MSQNTDSVPFRTQLKVGVTNILQKYRSLLVGLVVAAILVVGCLAIWTQIDASTKTDFARKIETCETDYNAWATETDTAKKTELGKTFEAELADIQKAAPTGYGLSKAWFLQGNYFVAQKKWTEASKAFQTAFDKDKTSYLAPIALVNSAVSLEESGDAAGALTVYGNFEKTFATNGLLTPQVFFTEGRLLESLKKNSDAVLAYKKLIEKYPDSSWTKLGRDRILFLSQE